LPGAAGAAALALVAMVAMGFSAYGCVVLARPNGFEQPVALSFFEQLCPNPGF
jgi:hypothetical protein